MIQYLKRNIFTIGCLALICFLAFIGDASAQMTIMQIATDKATNTFTAVRTIIFIIGGFGLVAVAFFAIFGKINWKWFAGLAVGLAILAAAAAIVNYATTADGTGKNVDFGDPLTSR